MKYPHPTSTLAALAALALAVGTTQAATIYNHDFGGLATDGLNGVTPDTTTGANTWTASTNINADGSIASLGTTTDSAWLAFTPQSGFVYTLTAVMGQAKGGTGSEGGSWMAMGFSASNTTSTFQGTPNNTSPWALHRSTGNGNNVVSFAGPGATVSEDHGAFVGTITMSIVLDTTDTQWTATWFQGATELREVTYAVDANPTISHVGFGRSNRAVGPVESFTLTAIPEPTTALLGGLGMLALLRRRR